MATTKETVEQQVESVMKTLLLDLRRRKSLNIAPLIEQIKFDVKQANDSGVAVVFTFERVEAEVRRTSSGAMVYDPLFRKLKPLAVKQSEMNRYGKNSIYNKLNRWFDRSLVPALIEVNTELARNIVLEIV